jgi:hypothetical protein
MKNIIKSIFDDVKYWQDKTMLLQAIKHSHYTNKDLMIHLLKIPSFLVEKQDEAKMEMWNHMIVSQKLGDDLLHNIDENILDDIEFAKKAIYKYNRTYIYLTTRLQEDYDIATMTASNEMYSTNKYNAPILMYMPDNFQNDLDLSLIASSRNIYNIQYAPMLQINTNFIIDIMNTLSSHEEKQKVLSFIDQDLLSDKIFVSKLGCFDNLCDKFQGDIIYVSNAVIHDINILKKTELFHESILKSVLYSEYYKQNKDIAITIIFDYIQRFNNNHKELNGKIKDKNILNKLLWDSGDILLDEFIHI